MTGTYVTRAYDRLDRICFDHYGSDSDGQLDAILAANPGLDLQPLLLAEGLTIILPDLEAN